MWDYYLKARICLNTVVYFEALSWSKQNVQTALNSQWLLYAFVNEPIHRGMYWLLNSDWPLVAILSSEPTGTWSKCS